MYLLVHENHIDPASMSEIKRQSMATTIGKIRTKKPVMPLDDVHVMDIESYRNKQDDGSYHHEPLIVGHVGNGRYAGFKGHDCLDRYFRWLRFQRTNMVVWAHNGGKYDFHVMAGAAIRYCDTSRDQPIELLDVDGRYIEVVVHFDTGCTIKFRDSFALIPASLAKIAREFGVTNKMDDLDIVNVSRDQLLSDPRYVAYNDVDCVALHEVLSKYRSKCMDQFGTDPLAHPSASSYAKRVFYSRYYDPCKYPFYVLPRRVHKYLENAYGGGRCEVFRRTVIKGPLYYYDINSSYPHAGTMMLPYDKPREYRDLRHVRPDQTEQFVTEHPGIYQVKVLANGRGQPLHGVMTAGKFVFPRFDHASPSIYVFSEELRYGLSFGYRYQLVDGFEFKMAPWGKNFFATMFGCKLQSEKDGNDALRWVYKIMANSGYGFFGYGKYDRQVTRVHGPNMKAHAESLQV